MANILKSLKVTVMAAMLMLFAVSGVNATNQNIPTTNAIEQNLDLNKNTPDANLQVTGVNQSETMRDNEKRGIVSRINELREQLRENVRSVINGDMGEIEALPENEKIELQDQPDATLINGRGHRGGHRGGYRGPYFPYPGDYDLLGRDRNLNHSRTIDHRWRYDNLIENEAVKPAGEEVGKSDEVIKGREIDKDREPMKSGLDNKDLMGGKIEEVNGDNGFTYPRFPYPGSWDLVSRDFKRDLNETHTIDHRWRYDNLVENQEANLTGNVVDKDKELMSDEVQPVRHRHRWRYDNLVENQVKQNVNEVAEDREILKGREVVREGELASPEDRDMMSNEAQTLRHRHRRHHDLLQRFDGLPPHGGPGMPGPAYLDEAIKDNGVKGEEMKREVVKNRGEDSEFVIPRSRELDTMTERTPIANFELNRNLDVAKPSENGIEKETLDRELIAGSEIESGSESLASPVNGKPVDFEFEGEFNLYPDYGYDHGGYLVSPGMDGMKEGPGLNS